MKALLLMAIFALTSVHAEEIKVLEVNYNYGTPQVTLKYNVNKKLGRAWIEVRVDTSSGDSSIGDDFYRQLVEGLRYDEVTKAIVLDRDGQLIECAKYDKGSLFRIAGYKATGCTLNYRLIKVVMDDGFRTYKVDRVAVYLNTKD